MTTKLEVFEKLKTNLFNYLKQHITVDEPDTAWCILALETVKDKSLDEAEIEYASSIPRYKDLSDEVRSKAKRYIEAMIKQLN